MMAIPELIKSFGTKGALDHGQWNLEKEL